MRNNTKTKASDDASGAGSPRASTGDAAPAGRLLEGDPPRLRLAARREEARAGLGEGWRAPLPSRATRTWGLKSSGSMRVLIASVGDHLIACESGLEWRTAVVAAAHPRVVAVREQAEAVEYADGNVARRHVPDFVVSTVEGREEALIVKPDRWAAGATRLAATLDARRAGDLDAFHHVGGTKLARSIVKAADLVGVVRRDGPASGDPEVARLRAAIDRPMTIEQAVEGANDPGVAFRAVVRLIADGHVRVTDGWGITHDRTVEPCAVVGGEARP